MATRVSKQRRKRHSKPLLWSGILLVAVVLGAGYGAYAHHHQDAPKINGSAAKTSTKGATTDSSADTIRFIATGDELPHDSVDQNAKTASGTYDYLPFFSPIQPYMTSADMSFCNQESPSDPAAAISAIPPSMRRPASRRI